MFSKNKPQIDIFVSVIDNYGDIGFLTELLAHFFLEGDEYQFRIFTDNVAKVAGFLTGNKEILPNYSLFSLSEFQSENMSEVSMLLFHFPLPEIDTSRKILILRIDYLSFDINWVKNNNSLHIASTDKLQIREIIPSFLSGGAGVLELLPQKMSRKDFLTAHGLKEDIKNNYWISLFAYPKLLERIDFSYIPDNVRVFVFGYDTHFPNLINLPFLPIRIYQDLLRICDANLVRGEVSAVAAMNTEKPFLWDMYKEMGGFSQEMSADFLDFFEKGDVYRDFHKILNQSDVKISIEDIITVLKNENKSVGKKNIYKKTLTSTLKKYIDRFYFSL